MEDCSIFDKHNRTKFEIVYCLIDKFDDRILDTKDVTWKVHEMEKFVECNPPPESEILCRVNKNPVYIVDHLITCFDEYGPFLKGIETTEFIQWIQNLVNVGIHGDKK